jgi:hypothetical protein
MQFIAGLATAAKGLAGVFPAAQPEVDAIGSAIEKIMAKVNQTTSPAQPQAPPI